MTDQPENARMKMPVDLAFCLRVSFCRPARGRGNAKSRRRRRDLGGRMLKDDNQRSKCEVKSYLRSNLRADFNSTSRICSANRNLMSV